jgi:4a-hydroxytetrahydrobiopterin dehydratase
MGEFILQDYDFRVLLNNNCHTIAQGEVALTDEEIRQAMEMVFASKLDRARRWKIKNIKEVKMLSGGFGFSTYQETFAFVSAVYLIADNQGYYPDITFGDGFAYVSLFTIRLGGLYENDFIMLAKIENLMKDAIAKNE